MILIFHYYCVLITIELGLSLTMDEQGNEPTYSHNSITKVFRRIGSSNANVKRGHSATLGSPGACLANSLTYLHSYLFIMNSDAPLKKRICKVKPSTTFKDDDEDMEDDPIPMPPAASSSE